jgi:uncharacterized protein (TIGR00369 family)
MTTADVADDSLLDQARRVLSTQRFGRWLGAELLARTRTSADMRLVVRPWFRQADDLIDDGLIAYLADNALAFAATGALGLNVATSEFTLRYLRPAKGDVVWARARLLNAGWRHAVCHCDVIVSHPEQGSVLCATAHGTLTKRA